MRDVPTAEAAGLTQWTFATFLQKWTSLVRGTKTPKLFEAGWMKMKEHIPIACAEYIHNSWLNPYKKKIVAAWMTFWTDFIIEG